MQHILCTMIYMLVFYLNVQVGVMGTHDEETRRFFKHSNVDCLLAPRYADKKSSWFKQKVR